MNEEKFENCLQAYLQHCATTTWIKDECYKFYFANWLYRKVNLALQSNEKIYQTCREALKRDFSLKKDLSNIGVNFLQKSGREKLSIPLEISDIEIVQFLKNNDVPDEDFFKGRGTSYPALAAWLGTLLPKRFLPIGTSDFHETVAYLFDLADFPQGGYQFFVRTQQYFKETKDYLKNYDLEHLYLSNTIQYLKETDYPNVDKKRYEEIDWNWITQDFHLFIFRKYLHDKPFKADQKNKHIVSMSTEVIESINQTKEVHQVASLEIYELSKYEFEDDDNVDNNRNLAFDKDHYLKKYKRQLEKGSWVEEIVKQDEIKYLLQCGREDLANRVEIVSANPDYGFDVLSFELDGTKKQIEVKSISTDKPKSFFISANELRKSGTLANYYIYCVLSKEGEVQKICRLKSPDLNNEYYFKIKAVNYEVQFL